MPNWVTNVLTFNNEEDTRKVFLGMQWHNKRFSFKAIRPHPVTYSECEDKYLVRNDDHSIEGTPKKPWLNWYDWQSHFWGCKWDCSDVYWHETSITFKTPWDPPNDDLLQAVADKFQVEFTIKAWDEGENEEEQTTMFQTRTFKPMKE